MRKQKIQPVNVLELAVLACILVFTGALYLGKTESKTPFHQVERQVKKAVGKDFAFTEAGSGVWKRYYGLNPKEFDGAVLLYSEGVMDVEEVLLIKVKEETQAEDVEKSIEERLSVQKKNFEGYGAGQMKLLKNAVVETRGTYIFMAVSKNAVTYQKAFEESL